MRFFILFIALLSTHAFGQLKELDLQEFKLGYHYSTNHRSWNFKYKTMLDDNEYDALPTAGVL